MNKKKYKLEKEIRKTILALRKIRRKPPGEFGSEEIEAISWALDYLEEELNPTKICKGE